MKRSRTIPSVAALLLLVGAVSGCHEPAPVAFEENLVHAKKWEIQTGLPFDQVVRDANWALLELFGTPDAPKLPESITEDEELATLVSMENLMAASGSEWEAGRGLYRLHCARCHGITGNGRGEAAALVDPYPRDYRMGLFKFKTTERNSMPLKADLAHAIRVGVAGTSMVPDYQLDDGTVGPLPEDQIAALVDYVIYLTMRGQVERAMYDDAALELDLEGGDRVIDPALATTDKEAFDEQWEIINDMVLDVADAWLSAEDEVVEVELPDDVPVPANWEEMQSMLVGDQAEALKESIERGRELFVSTVASCSKCHGETGKGDGQEADYDDWAKDWTVRAGLDPADLDSLTPLIARGALPPRTIKPRNFEEGVFRGGDRPEDLYHRLIEGIAGTPMPAITLVEGQLEEVDVWHLINFVRSLRVDPVADASGDQEAPEENAPPAQGQPQV